MDLANLRFTESAFFYKLKGSVSLSESFVQAMMKDVTNGLKSSLLFNIVREDGGNDTSYSLRVFKKKTEKPSFFVHSEPGWEEVRVGYFLFIECDDYVVVMKRYANLPKCIIDKLDNVDYTTLMALETRQNSVFKKLSMQNMDGSDYAMRSKTYESLDLSKNVSLTGIHRYYLRSIVGNNGNQRFSLTLDTSKIDEFETNLTVKDVCGWVRRKVNEINSISRMPDTILSAFAKPEKYSSIYASLRPDSLLLFYGLLMPLVEEPDVQIIHTRKNGQKKLIDSQVFVKYIDYNARAYTRIKPIAKDGVDHYYTGWNDAIEIRITKTGIKLYNRTWRSISIEGTKDGEHDGDLQTLINCNNQFNVYFSDNELVYSNRTLFRDTRLLESITQLEKVLNVLPGLESTDCEKYTQKLKSYAGLSNWGVNSIFSTVERCFKDQYTHFICDDCKYEWADHIGVSEEKVSFFVSKHKGSKDSASDFQDVVAQALKNLGNLSPSSGQLNAKVTEWNDTYQNSQINRMRSNNGMAQDAASLWKKNVMSPNFVREMCLVVDFLSKEKFKTQLDSIANNNPVAHEEALFQRLWLLSSFVNGCMECGVKPVIYCKS